MRRLFDDERLLDFSISCRGKVVKYSAFGLHDKPGFTQDDNG